MNGRFVTACNQVVLMMSYLLSALTVKAISLLPPSLRQGLRHSLAFHDMRKNDSFSMGNQTPMVLTNLILLLIPSFQRWTCTRNMCLLRPTPPCGRLSLLRWLHHPLPKMIPLLILVSLTKTKHRQRRPAYWWSGISWRGATLYITCWWWSDVHNDNDDPPVADRGSPYSSHFSDSGDSADDVPVCEHLVTFVTKHSLCPSDSRPVAYFPTSICPMWSWWRLIVPE